MSKKKINRPIIIGFDESNNGWGIKSNNPHYDSTMIFTGYIDFNQSLHSGPIRKKPRLFGRNGNIEYAVKKASQYMSLNPDFLYVPIPKESSNGNLIEVLKANAIVALTLNFLLKYGISQNQIGIITDEFDGPENSERTHNIIDWWFEKLKIDIPHIYKRNADNQIRAVVRADRISHYIGAIHHLGDNPKWPYRQKKVSLYDLEKLAIALAEKNETSYPEP
jgi:hypothetical protein